MLDTIICWIKWAVHAVGQTMLTVVDLILSALILAVNAIVWLLPNDPTGEAGSIDGGILGALNYFVPVGFIVGQFGVIMIAWMLYRLYQWLLRWAKAEG